uniref:Uncharacterized protein n=1 Tax=Anguilla anguilla TaxID=7936 RepID=A0A0E9S0H1_ANGAN
MWCEPKPLHPEYWCILLANNAFYANVIVQLTLINLRQSLVPTTT